jgi:TPR repeat protein
MNTKVFTVLISSLLLVLSLIGCSSADTYKDGVKAYDSKNYAKAFKIFSVEANKGNPEAQHSLGLMYNRGDGNVRQDYKEAVKWYSAAAEKGNVNSLTNLAIMYLNGTGVPQNYINGYAMSSLAASYGNPDAKANMEIAAKKMTPEQIKEALKLAQEIGGKKEQPKPK